MRIRGQTWIETDTHLVMTLHEPWWGAWKHFGWEAGVEGIGISLESIHKAEILGKKIRVNVLKYGSYEITARRALNFQNNTFTPRDKKPIIVIPKTAFDKVNTEQEVKKYEKKEEYRGKVRLDLMLKLRDQARSYVKK